MKRHLLTAAFALTLLGQVACGGREAPGEACGGPGYACLDAATALECRSSRWVSIPCRGPEGCTEGDVIHCDMSLNVEGDPCPTSASLKGMCTADGTATLECRVGTFVKTNACSTCVSSGQRLTCTP
jgi:hypothetical protein